MSPGDLLRVQLLRQPSRELLSYLREGVADSSREISIEPPPPGATGGEPGIPRDLAASGEVMVGWRPTASLLERAESMGLFINPGAGVQHLIEPFRKLRSSRPEVILVNGHGNAGSTAQHAVAMLLALSNGLIPHHNWMTEGRWRTGDRELASIPLSGSRTGLLGYGHVNRRVHGLLSGFEMSFAALRTAWEQPEDPGVNGALLRYLPDQLDELLDWADVLIVSVPLTSRTRGMLRRRELERLGPRGLLVNVSRGAVIDEEDLFESLRLRLIGGAAIDVWYDYSPSPAGNGTRFPSRFPFGSLDNVVLSPHRAASPFSDLARWDEVIENLRRYSEGRSDLLNRVDLEREY